MYLGPPPLLTSNEARGPQYPPVLTADAAVKRPDDALVLFFEVVVVVVVGASPTSVGSMIISMSDVFP